MTWLWLLCVASVPGDSVRLWGVFWALGDLDQDRNWVGLGHRLGWGFCWGRSVGPPFFSLGPWCVAFPFPCFFSFFCSWGLRGSEPWGCLWTFLSFYFFSIFFSLWTLGHS